MAAPGLVLVHSPLLEASSWCEVAAGLQADGSPVVVPDFGQVFSETSPFFPKIARSISENIAGLHGDIVLVGHSGAGALLPAIAAALGSRVRGALFVDAILPHPGKPWFDTVPPDLKVRLETAASDGWLPPWNTWWPDGAMQRLLPREAERTRFVATLRPRPLAYFNEVAPQVELPSSVRCGYLQLSAAYESEAQQADRLGWPVQRKMLGHLAMVTDPRALALAIQALSENLGL